MLKTRLEKRQKQDNHGSQSSSQTGSLSNNCNQTVISSPNESVPRVSVINAIDNNSSSKSNDNTNCQKDTVMPAVDPQSISSSSSNISSSSGSTSPPVNHGNDGSDNLDHRNRESAERLPVSSKSYSSHLLLQRLRSQYRPKLSDIPLYLSEQDVSNQSISVSSQIIMPTTTDDFCPET